MDTCVATVFILFVQCLFFFGASWWGGVGMGAMFFIIVTFPGNLHLNFDVNKVFQNLKKGIFEKILRMA